MLVVIQILIVANMKLFFFKYKKPIIITIAITVLQVIWGFDPKFCIINLVWLFV